MKKKLEKRSAGLIMQRLDENCKKRGQGSPLPDPQFFSSLSSFIQRASVSQKYYFIQPFLIDEQLYNGPSKWH